MGATTTTELGGSLADLTSENLYRDPYPIYATLRRQAPVHQFPETGEWMVTRWADCRTVGANPAIFGPSDHPASPEARVFGNPNILSMTGTEHACLRQGIDMSLQPDVVTTYIEALARPIVRHYVEQVRPNGAADLTTELFEPISVRVVASVRGLQDVTNTTLARWFHALAGGMQNPDADPGILVRLNAARAEIDEVLRPAVERVTSAPDQSLLAHMVHGGMPDGTARSYEQIIPTMRVFLLGGSQEPGHGAANAMLGVLQNPEARTALLQDPEGWALRAYDEGLRWIAPIGLTPRLSRQPFEIAGVMIPAGAPVAVVLASANRDEAFHEQPDAFRLDRKRRQHASFGYAPHFCSGHALGRAIGRISLEEAFKSLPNLRLNEASEVEARGWRFRGVTRLPALWDA